MKMKLKSFGFLTTPTRVLAKAICTRFNERGDAKAAIQDRAYVFDPTLVEDPTYGRSVEGGRSRLSLRFDRWRYKGSESETYRRLPGAAPAFVFALAEELSEKPRPLTDEDYKALVEASKREPVEYGETEEA